MQIFVKPRTVTLVVSPADSIASVKESIYKKDGTPPLLQRLVMSSRPLEDHSTLQNYKLERECTIHVTLRLLGGANPPPCPDPPPPLSLLQSS